jgi:prophage antirepressor-like protein
MVPETLDPADVGPDFRRRYEHLWMTLTDVVTVSNSDRYQIHTLLRTLNGLGFDVAELTADVADGGSSIRVRPKVVDAGHHRRRMLRLTGLEMHENQARRLLNDIDSYRYVAGLDHDEAEAARHWVTDVYQGVLQRIPRDLRAKLEAPELVHEVLAHRWFTSERSGADVGLEVATDDYVDTVLRSKPDEAAVLGPPVDDPDSADDVDAGLHE